MLEKIDVKHQGIPNICFSLTHFNDDREIEYSKQRIEIGFDDSETWSLRGTIAKFIIPRLERYIEITDENLEEDPELQDSIKLFLKTMKLVASIDDGEIMNTEKRIDIQKGLEVFPKIFMTLWW